MPDKRLWTRWLFCGCMFAFFCACGTSTVSQEHVTDDVVQAHLSSDFLEKMHAHMAHGDHKILVDAHTELQALWPLMAAISSPQAMSVHHALDALEKWLAQAPNQENTAAHDDRTDIVVDAASELLDDLREVRRWASGEPPSSSWLADLHCVDGSLVDTADCAFGIMRTRFDALPTYVSPLVAEGIGDLKENGHRVLAHMVVPVNVSTPTQSTTLSYEPVRLWTQLPDDETTLDAPSLTVRIDMEGVRIGVADARIGLQVIGDEKQRTIADFCTLSDDTSLIIRWRDRGEAARLNANDLATIENRLDVCAALVQPGVHPAIVQLDLDATWTKESLSPLLIALYRNGVAVRIGGVSATTSHRAALSVALAARSSHDTCGARVHVRQDGVVFRGLGTPTQLLSWSDEDAWARMTAVAKAAVERCADRPYMGVFIDDERVDWGLIVRVLERLSWPQVCDSPHCVAVSLVVEDGPH